MLRLGLDLKVKIFGLGLKVYGHGIVARGVGLTLELETSALLCAV